MSITRIEPLDGNYETARTIKGFFGSNAVVAGRSKDGASPKQVWGVAFDPPIDEATVPEALRSADAGAVRYMKTIETVLVL